nr:DUF3826 domain-containing protein [uncultured Pedobacter sp.]
MKLVQKTQLIVVLLLMSIGSVKAQRSDTAYVKAITERSWKIVEKLNIPDEQQAIKVRDIIANQYMDLNDVYIYRDAEKKEIEASGKLSKAQKKSALEKTEKKVAKRIDKLHRKYINNLSKNLTSEQVIAVKDGMTYGVVPLTFGAYQEMLPNLTQEQKNQIYIWLVEAREHAMDAESSEKKHAWFGKYKGRINNYLSAAGIDMKKAGEEWQERIKAAKNNK